MDRRSYDVKMKLVVKVDKVEFYFENLSFRRKTSHEDQGVT